MPKVTINGKELDAPEGINVIQAADMLGMEIPHYCYHPALTVVGNCRMCLVEIEKAPKLQIACNTKVTEGMVVHTNSDKAKAAQRAVLEFLLINHPIDCPVCDQAGECKLQDYYMDYDRQESRFPLRKKVKKGKAIDIGSDVMLDQERCVLCGRCTRFLDEVTKTSELAIFERGDHNRIDIFPGRKVDNNYAGNIIDICPVGALTEKDFRFRMRVWYLHRTPSVCAGCERGCSIDIYENHGKIFRYKPRHNPLVNGYWMCDEGRHSFKRMQTETRITSPLYQSGDRMMPERFATSDPPRRRRDPPLRRNPRRGLDRRSDRRACDQRGNLRAQELHQGCDRLRPDRRDELYAAGRSAATTIFCSAPTRIPIPPACWRWGLGSTGWTALAQAVASGQLKTLIALRADAYPRIGRGGVRQTLRRAGLPDFIGYRRERDRPDGQPGDSDRGVSGAGRHLHQLPGRGSAAPSRV